MEKKHFHFGRRLFLGIVFLYVGIFWILRQMGYFELEYYDFYDDVLMSWRMLVFGLGVFIFLSGSRTFGLIVAGLGVLSILNTMYTDFGDFLWPIIFLFIGVVLIFGGLFKRKFKPTNTNFNANFNANTNFHHKEYNGNYKAEKVEVSSDYFDEFVIFGGRDINMSTINLRGGRSTAVFGGAEVDLRQCQISPSGCTVELTSIFGANVVKVPNDWTVLNRVTTIFGGYSDLRIKDASYAPTPSKTIVITGVCIFGGTEVRNFNKLH